MENQKFKPKKFILVTGFFSLFVIIVVSIVFYFYGKNSAIPLIEEKEKKITKLSFELDKMSSAYFSTSETKDSALRENVKLSKYRSLTDAMSYRDSIRKPLLFNVGDIVHLKRDSSRVIINDILVGGGKFLYYVKYQVLYKDNSTETVSPELIY